MFLLIGCCVVMDILSAFVPIETRKSEEIMFIFFKGRDRRMNIIVVAKYTCKGRGINDPPRGLIGLW